MKKTMVFVLIFAGALGLTTVQPGPARADEDAVRTIFLDTFYGMAAGALIGSAVSLSQDDPDWGKNIGSGAAIGGIAGALFGIVSEVSYMVEIQDGKVMAGLPRVDVAQRRISRMDDTVVSAGLLRYRF
ncbi:MAG: hypothetical protein HY760_01820 [Nitrospirae bacterium]|nr:hypothetical protein [Nitrospirota bacterium]